MAGEPDPMAELKAMIAGLGDKMGEIRGDIKDVRTELGQRIEDGRKATEDLKQRMDVSDQTFAARVAAVVAGIPASGLEQPSGPVSYTHLTLPTTPYV